MGDRYREYLRTQKANAGKARISANSTAATAKRAALARKQSRVPYASKGKRVSSQTQMKLEER